MKLILILFVATAVFAASDLDAVTKIGSDYLDLNSKLISSMTPAEWCEHDGVARLPYNFSTLFIKKSLELFYNYFSSSQIMYSSRLLAESLNKSRVHAVNYYFISTNSNSVASNGAIRLNYLMTSNIALIKPNAQCPLSIGYYQMERIQGWGYINLYFKFTNGYRLVSVRTSGENLYLLNF